MTKMTANNRWIPYMHKIAARQCNVNIHFGELAVRLPFVSHAFGYHAMIQYEFSDSTLSYLLNELKLWSSEVRGKDVPQKYTMTLTHECLNQVTTNTFIHFVHNFPENVFDLNLLIDWRKFHAHQEEYKLVKYTEHNGEKQAYSPTGVPLLQLCIQNEASSRNWVLKDMMYIILENKLFSAHDAIHGSPLTVALRHDCYESIRIMNSGDYNFDYQTLDARGISFYGHLVMKLQEVQSTDGFDRKL